MDLPTHQSMDKCGYADVLVRMYCMVYLDASFHQYSVLCCHNNFAFKKITLPTEKERCCSYVVFFYWSSIAQWPASRHPLFSRCFFFMLLCYCWPLGKDHKRIIWKFKVLNLQWFDRIFSPTEMKKKRVRAIWPYLNAKRNMTALNAWKRL